MEYQLSSLSLQELNLKREHKCQNDFTQFAALNWWEEKACEDLKDLKLVLKSLNATLQKKENEFIQIKRIIVQILVPRVDIGNKRKYQLLSAYVSLPLLVSRRLFIQSNRPELITVNSHATFFWPE